MYTHTDIHIAMHIAGPVIFQFRHHYNFVHYHSPIDNEARRRRREGGQVMENISKEFLNLHYHASLELCVFTCVTV